MLSATRTPVRLSRISGLLVFESHLRRGHDCCGDLPLPDAPERARLGTATSGLWRQGLRPHDPRTGLELLTSSSRPLFADSLSRGVSLEGVRPQEPHLFLVETGLHPAQHDVVDALLVAQLEERLAPTADECE
jgi:hypothetical protein